MSLYPKILDAMELVSHGTGVAMGKALSRGEAQSHASKDLTQAFRILRELKREGLEVPEDVYDCYGKTIRLIDGDDLENPIIESCAIKMTAHLLSEGTKVARKKA